MRFTLLWCFVLISTLATLAQQRPDTSFALDITAPAYAPGTGPVVAIDGGHGNFHQVDNRFSPFARVLRTDGYRVLGHSGAFTAESLEKYDVLVIANPLHPDNQGNWQLPTPSAFTAEEIKIVRDWVASGGSLFLIADHMPFPGAARDLGRAFGFELTNGFAMDNRRRTRERFLRQRGTLHPNAITNGLSPVDSVISFTGSAFYAPPEAVPILSFDVHYTNTMPEIAWQFQEDTPFHSAEGMLQGAYRTFGNGRVVVFGEAAMFTAQTAGPNFKVGINLPEAKPNIQLLRNIMQWLVEIRDQKSEIRN
jgi:hypothetical protein